MTDNHTAASRRSAAAHPVRHQSFEAARHSALWTVDELWVQYWALGGVLPVFDVDAYLAGLMPMTPAQQDVLACALNEHLADLHHPTRVAYLHVLPGWLSDIADQTDTP
jgi:hypothetical protein